ncbi:GIY-YIG nuclease family protein [Rhodanobacter sp. Col0626]|uniref:GIY-YIG nuclease family protein n=1 Tax=Rhodanobacter sp. Col0626 TaxID=3415679 RepID=UPI003CF4C087
MSYPRFASRGRTYVYVLPCRNEDILKVGFSRDPLDRFRTLHRRFFEFFDLERGLLIHADQLRDARRIERLFITTFADCRAPAPLVVPQSAAGHTEWFRGVSPQVDALARHICAEQGFVLHAPLSAWLRERFGDWSELLFGWSLRMLEMIEYQHFNVPTHEHNARAATVLRDVLDAYVALDIDIAALLPGSVFDWYHRTDYFGSERER